jgi:hypothetical protein
MKLYIHYQNEWLGFEGPEKPPAFNFLNNESHPVKKYHYDLFEAANNSLKILNPEVIKIGDLQDNGAFIFPVEVQKGKYYQWPGTYEKQGYHVSINTEHVAVSIMKDGWILTPPAALEEESQDDLWDDVMFWISDTKEPIDTIDVLKERFTITRKQQTK